MLKLNHLFGDHAVLQRETRIPVWGWCEPFTLVTGRLGEVASSACSGDDGKFVLDFPPLPAGGPYELEITTESGAEKLVFHDIMIGEIWLAGGQSNMEFTLMRCNSRFPGLLDRIAANAKIRMITVPRVSRLNRMSDFKADWQIGSLENFEQWSAVAAIFADKLSRELGVTVGIISSNWGGTVAAAWTGKETLLRNPAYRTIIQRDEAEFFSTAYWAAFPPDKRENIEQKEPTLPPQPTCNAGEQNNWHMTDFDDSDWRVVDLPRCWSDFGKNINGVIWFRRKVTIPAEWVGRELVIEFCPIDKQDITYLNGVEIGRTGSGLDDSFWDVPRRYTVPGKLVTGTTLTLAVRNYSFKYDAGFRGDPAAMRMFPADAADIKAAVPLRGQWCYAVEFKTAKIVPHYLLEHGLGASNRSTALFDNMIAPLIPCAMRGVIYYQGESDERNSANYRRLMRDLITDWRFRWGNDFPFLQVLLAGYRVASPFAADCDNWPYIREAQLAAADDTGNLVASALDVGEANDIHPHDKVTVGERLAAAALVQAYGRPGPGTGPVFREATPGTDGRSMRLRFDHVGGGLTVKGERLGGFYATGEYLQFSAATFQAAEARIVTPDTVEVRLPDNICVSAVRYAWSDNPECANLYNLAGFPAAPFRTDRGERGMVVAEADDAK